jgi:hypothetical protein
MCSDIFPTGNFAAKLAEINNGDTMDVFGWPVHDHQREPLTNVLKAYKAFDTRQPGWGKV